MWYLEFHCKTNFDNGGAQHVREALSTDLTHEDHERAKRLASAMLSERRKAYATEITSPELVWRESIGY